MTTYIKTSATVVAETGSLDLARIGWHTLARSLNPTVSTEADGYPALAARTDNTYEFWKPTAVPAWWRVDLGAATAVNYVGIAAHNIGTQGGSVKVQYSSDDVSWSDASAATADTPNDDGEILFLFPEQTARYWRLYFDTAIPTVGVVYLGTILTMERGLYQGHSPITLARETVIRPSISERGQWLGRTVIRSGLKTSAQWKNLTPNWYRASFDPFVEAARDHPFFFAWRPSDYPGELGFVSCDSDITPQNSGPREFMSVGFVMKGAGYA